MNLGELLSELRDNILHDRSDRVAGTSDWLWSDATLVRYINEAQKRFARRGLVIRDGVTPDVCQIILGAGQNVYNLHPSILAVISARRDGDNADLKRAGHAAFDTYSSPDPYYFDPAQIDQLPPGKPLAFSTDEYLAGDDYDSMSVTTLRLYPTPSAEYAGTTLRLRVIRMPLEELVPTRLKAVPEIPQEHHMEMLDWAAYLALRIVDVDAGMPQRATEFRISFDDHVKNARNAAMRKLFSPLQWGYGRNGFTWER